MEPVAHFGFGPGGCADRVQVTVPALSAVMKWPAGRAPEGWWGDFDSLTGPWLDGTAFKDGSRP